MNAVTTLLHSLILFVSIPNRLPDGTSLGILKYSESTISKLFGCVRIVLTTSSVVLEIYLTLIPVSSNNFFSGSDPILTAVPKYLIVGVPDACIAGNPVIKPDPIAAPANAVVDFSILLLVIFLLIFLDICAPF